jgi:hypothetical protein
MEEKTGSFIVCEGKRNSVLPTRKVEEDLEVQNSKLCSSLLQSLHPKSQHPALSHQYLSSDIRDMVGLDIFLMLQLYSSYNQVLGLTLSHICPLAT